MDVLRSVEMKIIETYSGRQKNTVSDWPQGDIRFVLKGRRYNTRGETYMYMLEPSGTTIAGGY